MLIIIVSFSGFNKLKYNRIITFEVGVRKDKIMRELYLAVGLHTLDTIATDSKESKKDK